MKLTNSNYLLIQPQPYSLLKKQIKHITRTVFLVTLCMIKLSLFAESGIKSNIKQVKVYKQKAEITRTLTTTVKPGRQELILTGISTSINPSSLQVEYNNPSSTLLSVKHQNNYLTPKVDKPKIDILESQIKEFDAELAWIKDQRVTLKGMEEILNNHKNLSGGEKGYTPAQVTELIASYKKQLLEIRKELTALHKQQNSINTEKSNVRRQLEELNAPLNIPSSNIVLLIDSDRSQSVTISCSYIVSNAGWSPLYDIRSKGIEKDVKLNYKANIYQNTGVDWTNIDMIVSTGNPSLDNNRPILRPLYTNVYKRRVAPAKQKDKVFAQSSQNMAYISNGTTDDGYQYNTEITENQLSVEYKIMKKQTIETDQKINMLALTSYDLNTNYVYHTVPKLNQAAFLLAKISNWGRHNLISGPTNIFYEGAFVGTSTIDPNITSDTLLISMGIDENIIVKREPINKYTTTKFVKLNKKESYGYEVVVRNKKSIPIEIEILDQIPVSQNSEIEVSLDKKGKAEYVKEYGKLLWKLSLAPGQSSTEGFAYTIKHPKRMAVSGKY